MKKATKEELEASLKETQEKADLEVKEEEKEIEG